MQIQKLCENSFQENNKGSMVEGCNFGVLEEHAKFRLLVPTTSYTKSPDSRSSLLVQEMRPEITEGENFALTMDASYIPNTGA